MSGDVRQLLEERFGHRFVRGEHVLDAVTHRSFAAESENLAQNAKAKLAKKKLPLIVGNLAQEAMGRDDSAITLYDAEGEHPLGRGAKLELARKLVEHVASRLPQRK